MLNPKAYIIVRTRFIQEMGPLKELGANEVIPEESWDQKRDDIRRLGVTTFVMGDDWRGKFDDLKSLCDVVYLPRTSMVSTTSIKEAVTVLQQIAREYTIG